MLRKKFNQEDFATNSLSRKLIHVKEKNCLRFKLVQNFQALHKNNPRPHSLQQDKKAVLMTAAHFNVLTPTSSQGQ